MKAIKYIAAAALCLTLASCSKNRLQQMEMAENVISKCEPAVLEAVAGKIPATISVTYPKDYFVADAMMVVTPVLVYEGGQQTGQSYIYQGEKIKENNKVVTKAGGTVTEKMVFDFVPGMEKSHLELRSVIIYNSKSIPIPAVKVADGCNTTYMLVDAEGAYQYKPDGYEEVEHRTSEVQIRYDVNSSDIRNTAANTAAMRDMKATLEEMKENERATVTGTEIIAYASPEGGEDLNAKLSDKRAASAQKAWSKVSKDSKNTSTEIKSIGQDWDGFQEAVANSKIEDKDLILRVLSMYSDPAVRESEIKNMSAIYSELKDEVFPELRRARFITNIDYQNYTEEEIQKLAQKRLYMLSEEQVLRLAAISEDPERKAMYYRLAGERYGSDKGYFNLAMTNLDSGKNEVAQVYLDKVSDQNDPDVLNAKGVIALRNGKQDEAIALFKKSASAEANQNLAAIDILNGRYAEAAAKLAGTGSKNEALAALLNGNLSTAANALKGDDARTAYIKAIVAARQGKTADAKKALESAQKCDKLKERASKDIEFADFR